MNYLYKTIIHSQLIGGIHRGTHLRSPLSPLACKGVRSLVLASGYSVYPFLDLLKRPIRVRDWLRKELYGTGEPKFTSVDELRPISPARIPSGRKDALSVLIVDDFYADPDAVRKIALDAEYLEHAPGWWVSAWEGGPEPGLRGDRGFRHNGAAIRAKMEELIQAPTRDDRWELGGDGWNGAFHLRFEHPLQRAGGVHHHHGETARGTRETDWGWTGVLYLSPQSPRGSGTSIFAEKSTGLAYTEEPVVRFRGFSEVWKALQVEPKYNRLVLMDSRIFHCAELGFGFTPETARLTQTFFFDVQDKPAA